MNKLKKFLSQINVKDIKPSTYVSAVVLIFTMVNYVLNIMGKPVININENEIAAWVTAIVGVVGIVYTKPQGYQLKHLFDSFPFPSLHRLEFRLSLRLHETCRNTLAWQCLIKP